MVEPGVTVVAREAAYVFMYVSGLQLGVEAPPLCSFPRSMCLPSGLGHFRGWLSA